MYVDGEALANEEDETASEGRGVKVGDSEGVSGGVPNSTEVAEVVAIVSGVVVVASEEVLVVEVGRLELFVEEGTMISEVENEDEGSIKSEDKDSGMVCEEEEAEDSEDSSAEDEEDCWLEREEDGLVSVLRVESGVERDVEGDVGVSTDLSGDAVRSIELSAEVWLDDTVVSSEASVGIIPAPPGDGAAVASADVGEAGLSVSSEINEGICTSVDALDGSFVLSTGLTATGGGLTGFRARGFLVLQLSSHAAFEIASLELAVALCTTSLRIPSSDSAIARPTPKTFACLSGYR